MFQAIWLHQFIWKKKKKVIHFTYVYSMLRCLIIFYIFYIFYVTISYKFFSMHASYVFPTKYTQARGVNYTDLERSKRDLSRKQMFRTFYNDLRKNISIFEDPWSFNRAESETPRTWIEAYHEQWSSPYEGGQWLCIYMHHTTKDCMRPWVSLSTHPGEPSSLHPHAHPSLSRASPRVDTLYRKSQDLATSVDRCNKMYRRE